MTSTANRIARALQRDDGHALLFAMFAVFLLGVSLWLMALNLQLRLGEQRREIGRVRVDLLVDGVAAETMARLALDPLFTGVSRRGLGQGEVWSEVMAEDSYAVIEARASLGRVEGRAVLRASLGVGGPQIVSWQRGGLPPDG